MTRLVFVAVLAAASVAHADGGSLPGGATITYAELWLHEDNNPDLALPKQTPNSLWLYFNLAHCQCSQPGGAANYTEQTGLPWNEGTFAYRLVLNGQTTLIHAPLEIWVGSSCDNLPTMMMTCHQIMGAGSSDMSTIVQTNGIKPEVPVYDLMNPMPGQSGCTPEVLSAAEWAISDVNSDGTIGGTPQYFVSQAINTDSLAPPLPTQYTVSAGESAIDISWKAPQGDVADIAYYQALCADMEGNPIRSNPPAAKYQTAFTLCMGQALTLTPTTLPDCGGSGETLIDAGVDAPPDAPADASSTVAIAPDASGGGTADAVANDETCGVQEPMGIAQQDPAFICGETDSATATSLRIDGLQNGTPYVVALLAIDKSGNAAGTYFNQTFTPRAVTDFWEDLQDRGSHVRGGLCLIAETYGDDNPLTQSLRGFRDDTLAHSAFGRWLIDVYYATLGRLGDLVHGHLALRVIAGLALLPLVVVALAWHLLGLPLLVVLIALIALRRRLRRALRLRPWLVAAASAALALAIAPGRAHAQASPYWDDRTSPSENTSLADEPLVANWHVGIRVGPYIPQIDAQLGVTPGPYKAMFGSKAAWTPMLDVDRVIWRGFGQVLIGATAGYMGKSAHAWATCLPDEDPYDCDPTNPKRMRSPGDTTSFHLIPFAVDGSYRLTTLDDDYGVPIVPYARVGLSYYVWWINDPSGSIASVGSNKALGASLGIQGTIGIAVRAERVDANAARSMRESGIEHAGFFGELQAAWVDGFGSSKKLAVGDNTWFAGIDFDF